MSEAADTTVHRSDEGSHLVIEIDRPTRRNALDPPTLETLREAFTAPPQEGHRVVVLRSTGPVFCAGLDLKQERRADIFQQVLEAIEAYPLPVVARVQGDAIAGGNELALHCDFVVASTRASFGMSLAKIGLAPNWFLCQKLLEVAGPVITREVLLLGEPLPAQRLYELGVIARLAPAHRLDSEVAAIVDRLADNAPLSLSAMKSLIHREMQYRADIPHDDVDELLRAVHESEDSREGVEALFEGRKARFRGR